MRLGIGRGFAQALPDTKDRVKGDGIDQKDHRRQHPVEIEHPGDGTDHGENISHQIIRQPHKCLTQQRDVIGKARNQPADRFAAQPGKIGMNKFGEHGVLHVLHDMQRHFIGLDGLGIQAHGTQRGQDDNDHRRQREKVGAALFEQVEGPGDQTRIASGRSGGNHR